MQHKNMRVIQALWHIEKWLEIIKHCTLVSTIAFYSLFTFIANKHNNKTDNPVLFSVLKRKLYSKFRDSFQAYRLLLELVNVKFYCWQAIWFWEYIHGPCRRFRGDQNDEDMRTFRGKFLYNAIASTDNAQHKNCPFSGIDDRPGRDLFRVLKRSPISQPHTLRLWRGYSDGKAVGNTTGLRRRLHPHWRISLLQSLCRALSQTEASSNF